MTMSRSKQIIQLAKMYGRTPEHMRTLAKKLNIPVDMTEAHHKILRNYFETCRLKHPIQKRKFTPRVREILRGGMDYYFGGAR